MLTPEEIEQIRIVVREEISLAMEGAVTLEEIKSCLEDLGIFRVVGGPKAGTVFEQEPCGSPCGCSNCGCG